MRTSYCQCLTIWDNHWCLPFTCQVTFLPLYPPLWAVLFLGRRSFCSGSALVEGLSVLTKESPATGSPSLPSGPPSACAIMSAIISCHLLVSLILSCSLPGFIFFLCLQDYPFFSFIMPSLFIVLIPHYHKNFQGVLQTHSFRLSLAVVSFIIFPGYWLCSVFWLIPHLGFLTSSPSAVMKSREPLPIPQVV